MRRTLSVRIEAALRDSLAKLAEEQGGTLSDVVRGILEDAVTEHPLKSRIAHLRGKLRPPAPESSTWRTPLRARNWRS